MGWCTDWGKYPAQWGADVPDGGDSSVPSHLNSRTRLGTAVLKHNVPRYSVLISILGCHDGLTARVSEAGQTALSVGFNLKPWRGHYLVHKDGPSNCYKPPLLGPLLYPTPPAPTPWLLAGEDPETSKEWSDSRWPSGHHPCRSSRGRRPWLASAPPRWSGSPA